MYMKLVQHRMRATTIFIPISAIRDRYGRLYECGKGRGACQSEKPDPRCISRVADLDVARSFMQCSLYELCYQKCSSALCVSPTLLPPSGGVVYI